MLSSLRIVAPRLLFRSQTSLDSLRLSKFGWPQARLSLVRCLATPPPQLNVSSLSMEQYHRLSDDVMDSLVEDLEVLLEEHGNPSFEVEYHSGVLTLKLGDTGTYVINKQPPNKQIWLSSPVSGPKRYDYTESDGSWRYSRDDKPLHELLNEELGQTFNKPIQLALPSTE